jgi:hypothetical protein
MKPYAQEAENLRLLFIVGIASIDDVVAWADRTILTLPEYDDDLVEISLGATVPRDEMNSRLRRVSEGADTIEAIRNLAGRMHQVLSSDRSWAKKFAGTLERLYYENDRRLPGDLAYSWDWDYRSFSKMCDNLITATAPFDKPTLWPTLPLSSSLQKHQNPRPGKGKSVRERLCRLFRGGQK